MAPLWRRTGDGIRHKYIKEKQGCAERLTDHALDPPHKNTSYGSDLLCQKLPSGKGGGRLPLGHLQRLTQSSQSRLSTAGKLRKKSPT